MTTLSLLLREPKRVNIAFIEDPDNQLTVDFLENESHSWAVDVTRFPVEEGADISDHVQPQPRTVTINGIVNETPLGFIDAATTDYSESRTVAAVKFLRDLYARRQTVTLATKNETYDRMICTGISFARGSRTGEKLPYTVSFTEITQVKSVEVPLKSPAKDADGSRRKQGTGSGTADGGKKPPKTATGAETNANDSLLVDLGAPGA